MLRPHRGRLPANDFVLALALQPALPDRPPHQLSDLQNSDDERDKTMPYPTTHASHRWWTRIRRPARQRTCLWRGLQLLILALLVVPASAQRAEAHSATQTFPAGWQDPTGGSSSFVLTTEYGAFDLGCDNADSSHYHGYYLASGKTAHLASDIDGELDDPIYPIADGVVRYSGELWGPTQQDVVLVEHWTTDNETFIATYAHLNSEVAVGDPVTPANSIGTLAPYGGAEHLHFGVVPGSAVVAASTVEAAIANSEDCSIAGIEAGTVDPLTWLQGRQPASAGSSTDTGNDDTLPDSPAEHASGPSVVHNGKMYGECREVCGSG